MALSAGAVEYTDYISAECPGYDMKQSDGEVPEIWGMRSTFYRHRSRVHSGREW